MTDANVLERMALTDGNDMKNDGGESVVAIVKPSPSPLPSAYLTIEQENELTKIWKQIRHKNEHLMFVTPYGIFHRGAFR